MRQEQIDKINEKFGKIISLLQEGQDRSRIHRKELKDAYKEGYKEGYEEGQKTVWLIMERFAFGEKREVVGDKEIEVGDEVFDKIAKGKKNDM